MQRTIHIQSVQFDEFGHRQTHMNILPPLIIDKLIDISHFQSFLVPIFVLFVVRMFNMRFTLLKMV